MAEIVGWSEPPSSYEEFMYLPLESEDGTQIRFDSARSDDLVLLRLNVPSASGVGFDATGIYPLAPSYTVEVRPSDIPAEVLKPHENRRNTPEIAGRKLAVLVCPMPGFELTRWAPKPEGVEKNGWKMRNEFLNLHRETEALRLFLNHWGLWDRGLGYEVSFLGHPHGFAIQFPHLLWRRQEEYRCALTGRPHKWLSTTNPLFLSQIKEQPYFIVQKSYCEDAIRSTITIDHLSNAKFGICKLNDCRELYQRESRQKRLYCTEKHAHLASVRKNRAKNKKKKSNRRNDATRKS